MTDVGQKIQQIFETIWQQRMQDMPMVNPVLSVDVIGFEKINNNLLGVLLTPWCMNLVLLNESDEWQSLKPGSKQIQVLPSGEYEFVVADEVGIGRFQTCSLFSPMFEFGDQQTALATAEAALSAVMTANPKVEAAEQAEQSAIQAQEKPTLSRRQFLRGMGLR
ncbi:MAG: [NiFe]-hydrogenase assembly chaperone HybE [Gammaproteobacteria bacterium]|nr:[NiFe]-hydrogenase assembly chaperone HybE [Gammaproteobacteria bacterium]